jgi:hypothetical protein
VGMAGERGRINVACLRSQKERKLHQTAMSPMSLTSGVSTMDLHISGTRVDYFLKKVLRLVFLKSDEEHYINTQVSH